MAEQEGRREVVTPKRAQSGQAPVVPLSPVMAPQRGSYGKTGPDPVAALLSETAKFGSVFFADWLQERNNEAVIEGQALYAQGKTYEELKESGADRFTEKGWKLMEAQTAGAQWYAAQKEKIAQSDMTVDPNEYRQTLSKATADLAKGRDADNTKFVMGMASKYIPMLVSEQTSAHYKYREDQTFQATVNSIPALSKDAANKNELLGLLSRPETMTLPSKGVVEQGNIDLFNRPRVKNPDGSISTVRSFSANVDGVEVLLPTIADDGRVMSEADAVKQYRDTGKHLGKFDSPGNATDYAKELHNQQGQLVGNVGSSPAAKLSMNRYRDALTEGILQSFQQDNPNAYATIKDSGIMDKAGLTSEQRARIRAGETAWVSRKKNEFDQNIVISHNQIVNDLKDSKITLPRALELAKGLDEARGVPFNMQDAKEWMNIQQSIDNTRRSEARADARAEDMRKRNKAENVAENRDQAIKYEAWLGKREGLDTRFQNGEINAQQYRTEGLKVADEVGLPLTQGVVGQLQSEVHRVAAEQERLRQKQVIIAQANSTENYTGLTSQETQAAITAKKQDIAKKYADEVAAGNMPKDQALVAQQKDYLDWWDRTGLIDTQTQKVFKTFLNSNTLDASGKVPDNATAAFAQFADLYNRNPKLAVRQIGNETDAAVAIDMLRFHQAPGDYAEAIKNYWSTQKSPVSPERAAEILSSSEVNEKITKGKKEYFEREDVSVWAAMFNPNADLRQVFRVSDRDIALATKNAEPLLDSAIRERAKDILRMNPGIDAEAATEAAITNVRDRSIMMGGTVLMSKRPGEILEKMFGEGGRAAYGNRVGVGHDALMTYLGKYGTDLFGTGFTDTSSSIRAAWAPMQEAKKEFIGPNLSVTQDPTGSGVLVRYERKDGTFSPVRAVSFRDMGRAWETEHNTSLKKQSDMRKANRAAVDEWALPPQQ
jgi:hypothetical protein